MRIGLDATKLLSPRDGIGTYVRSLLGALAEIGAEHAFHLYGLFPPPDAELLAAALPGLPPSWRLETRPWPRTGEVDVFHATTFTFPAGFAGPVVVSCYDLTFLTHPQTHVLENKLHCLTGLLEAVLADASFIAISQATRAELLSRFAIAQARVRVIYPAADERFRPLPDAEAAARVRERFGVAPPYLLSVGTLEPRKNLLRLLEAYAGLGEEQRRTLPLLIAGTQGWDGGELARRVTADPALATVRLLGHVADDDQPALYRSARALLYPSLAEGFGLPPLEALACGTPVLTSSTTSLPEVVGDAGRLLDPLDVPAWTAALAELAARPEVPAAARAAALAQAARFSWRRCAEETLDLYSSLL